MSPPPQVPYIGSTISLLSKANIRYEGFLYTIDQKESSVALSHVKVFGTEDRQCDRPVPPSDEIFEFIIFRASDITELKVIDTPPARSVPDPAIIRAQNKPPADQETNPSVKDFLMQAGPSAAAAGAASAVRSGREVKREPVNLPAAAQAATGNQARLPRNQAPVANNGPAAANANTGNNSSSIGTNNFGRSQQNRSSNQPKQQHQNSYYGNSYQQQQQQQQQRRPNFRGPPMPASQPPNSASSANGYYSGPYQQPPPHYGRYGGGPFYPAPMPPMSYFGYGAGGGGGPRRGGRPVMHFRRYHGGGGGGGRYGGGGGGGWGRNSQNHHQQQHQQQHRNADPIPARFTADYDFETANAEMEAELAKLSLNNQQQQNADGEGDFNQQDGDQHHEQQDQHQQQQQLSGNNHSGYDKEKSFYDDISRVEFDERTGAGDGHNGNNAAAPSGKKEAQKQNALNKETFGVIGGRMRRGMGNRFYGNRNFRQQRRAQV